MKGQEMPHGWTEGELCPDPPVTDSCFAALLHGNAPKYFAYACVLGRRLRETSPGPDRVLLCGPGSFCESGAARAALRRAGWDRLLPVAPISAVHLDKTCAKRHALVFTKLRVLELPYARVLLLDLDLLPRAGADLGRLLREVQAPAGKYHSCEAGGPEPEHGQLLSEESRESRWSPNAGVMRLDPLPTRAERRAQVAAMEAEVSRREGATYLPEQYYLAERLEAWRHIDKRWNWEVWPEWDDPGVTHPLPEACERARRQGWAGYYRGRERDWEPPGSAEVLQEVRVWHFSGSWDTAPWMFQGAADAREVHRTAAQLFRARDPGGVVATALAEWRAAFDDLLTEQSEDSEVPNPLRQVASELTHKASEAWANAWTCDSCGRASFRVRELRDVPWSGKYCSGDWSTMPWACADCVVAQLRGSAFKGCTCAADGWEET